MVPDLPEPAVRIGDVDHEVEPGYNVTMHLVEAWNQRPDEPDELTFHCRRSQMGFVKQMVEALRADAFPGVEIAAEDWGRRNCRVWIDGFYLMELG